MQTTKTRILVVEDDPALLRGLLDVLVYNGYEAKGIEDGGQGLDAALKETFDLILLDVMLPTLDGFSICKEVRKKKPGQGIIIITAKGFSLREVMVRVEAVLRRTGKTPGDVEIRFRDIFFDGKNLITEYQNQTMELTRKEMDIIAYLHRHRDRIVSKKELLTEVWQYADADIETRTVDIHMLKLRKKIARLIGDTPFVNTIRGEGYRLEPEK
jgi:two-component system response regulator RegX3